MAERDDDRLAQLHKELVGVLAGVYRRLVYEEGLGKLQACVVLLAAVLSVTTPRVGPERGGRWFRALADAAEQGAAVDRLAKWLLGQAGHG